MKQQKLFAISGVKNSGKTTLICELLKIFQQKGIKTAVIKHDGHDFQADVQGTDTYLQLQAGAFGTVVFSDKKYMLVKQQEHTSEMELADFFPEADLILLEGFKYSSYPKIEIVRRGNSAESVCAADTLAAIATNLPLKERETLRISQSGKTAQEMQIPLLDLDDAEKIAEFILAYVR